MPDLLCCLYELNAMEKVSKGNSFVHRLDARVKVVCAFLAIFTIVAIEGKALLILVLLISALLTRLSGIPLRFYSSRLTGPLLIAFFVGGVQFFLYGTHAAYTLNLGPIHLPVYREGLEFGTLLILRVLASAMVLLLVVFTTPMTWILEALFWLRVPKGMVDLAAMMVRYIFLLAEEGSKIYLAQKSRNGYHRRLSYAQKIRNYGTLGGMLLVRSFDQAEKTYIAMASRLYNPDSKVYVYREGIPLRDVATGGAAVLFMGLLLLGDKGVI